MIKAAFFDIDGTLLSFNTHRVSEGTVRAFETLHRHGVRTFISSGRPMVPIPSMPVSFEGYITMNGGLVFTSGNDGKTLLSNPIPVEDSNRWVDFAKERNLCTMMFSADGMMASQPNAIGLKIREQLEFEMPPFVPIDAMHDIEAYQLIAIMPAELDVVVANMLSHCRLPR